MASSSVREIFDQLAGEYDAIKLRVIPGYREVQALVDRYARVPEEAPARILELGCGTGEWAARFLGCHPNARFEGVEISEQMRGIASRRLEPFGDRVRLHDIDMNDDLPRGCFDLVVSFFAIHHVRDKGWLVGEIAARLADRGRFLWADISTAAAPAQEQLFREDWVAFMRDAGLDEDGISQVLLDHRENDLPETVESQLVYLRRASFDPATVVWSHGKFVLLFGRR
jgi:ubiquinone/menaquinone biosynthesis C-methylase UbiE